ncbi:MAG: SDR family NAD(P)-dependent oxidoreductase [Desulfobulbaceae bacterium]|nr:SDR family NAD(P)-dependent oxidoreductase [Desulfobulbaceae bacterium]
MLKIKGSVAVITGGASGIGLEMTRYWLQNGGKVEKKMSLGEFQIVIDINLTGVFLTVRECAERMISNGCRGLICLVSSTAPWEQPDKSITLPPKQPCQ